MFPVGRNIYWCHSDFIHEKQHDCFNTHVLCNLERPRRLGKSGFMARVAESFYLSDNYFVPSTAKGHKADKRVPIKLTRFPGFIPTDLFASFRLLIERLL